MVKEQPRRTGMFVESARRHLDRCIDPQPGKLSIRSASVGATSEVPCEPGVAGDQHRMPCFFRTVTPILHYLQVRRLDVRCRPKRPVCRCSRREGAEVRSPRARAALCEHEREPLSCIAAAPRPGGGRSDAVRQVSFVEGLHGSVNLAQQFSNRIRDIHHQMRSSTRSALVAVSRESNVPAPWSVTFRSRSHTKWTPTTLGIFDPASGPECTATPSSGGRLRHSSPWALRFESGSRRRK